MLTNKVKELSERAMKELSRQFVLIDQIAETNTKRVLKFFQRHRVSEACFAGTTGYGYNDIGRETLNRIYADIMGTPDAVVSPAFFSGTHAITAALFAAARPGNILLSVTGTPYDTLHGVIGINDHYRGSLKDYNVEYAEIDLRKDGSPNLQAIDEYIRTKQVGAIFVQRSRGYSTRRALSIEEIGRICDCVHETGKPVKVIVDNCYGEFVEAVEPGAVGADLIAGSLIKNPGGGLALCGGYVAGKTDLVEAAAYRLSYPGLGKEGGAAPCGHRLMYQGLYMAPHTVAQALKTAVYSARLFELLGFATHPKYNDTRSDIIQMIELGNPKNVKLFCKGIQASSPIDAYVTPVAAEMPGYDHEIIMAGGTFVQGASIELSADAPMREPYNVFLQGGLTFESGKHSVEIAASFLET